MKRLVRTILAAVNLPIALLFLAGYLAYYVPFGVFWWFELVAVFLPYLALVLLGMTVLLALAGNRRALVVNGVLLALFLIRANPFDRFDTAPDARTIPWLSSRSMPPPSGATPRRRAPRTWLVLSRQAVRTLSCCRKPPSPGMTRRLLSGPTRMFRFCSTRWVLRPCVPIMLHGRNSPYSASRRSCMFPGVVCIRRTIVRRMSSGPGYAGKTGISYCITCTCARSGRGSPGRKRARPFSMSNMSCVISGSTAPRTGSAPGRPTGS